MGETVPYNEMFGKWMNYLSGMDNEELVAAIKPAAIKSFFKEVCEVLYWICVLVRVPLVLVLPYGHACDDTF